MAEFSPGFIAVQLVEFAIEYPYEKQSDKSFQTLAWQRNAQNAAINKAPAVQVDLSTIQTVHKLRPTFLSCILKPVLVADKRIFTVTTNRIEVDQSHFTAEGSRRAMVLAFQPNQYTKPICDPVP